MSSEKTTIQSVQTHPTSWEPSTLRVSMNLQMEAAIVPSATSQCGSRVDSCHMVVLDDFLDAETTRALLDYLTDAGWDHSAGPPRAKWEQATCDSAVQGQRTWGLNSTVLDQLLLQPPPPVLEVQSRLAKTYPEVTIAHMPAFMLQPEAAAEAAVEAAVEAAEDSEQGARNPSASCSDGTGKAEDPDQEAQNGRKRRKLEEAGAGTGPGSPSGDHQGDRLGDEAELERKAEQGQQQAPDNCRVRGSFCSMFVGNAAVHGDEFSWHVDADPSSLPDSQWVDAFGRYFNREPGMPRFVSLLLYLNPEWSRSWDAETLILDTTTETGVFVRPKAGRAVLMDQDLLHRVSPPSSAAGGWPRYSLVWKLVFLPRSPGPRSCSLARPEWGAVTPFGSAHRLQQVKQQIAAGKVPGE